jgi:tripartite-type tricarboxylate transporter receptor subunit TctC
VRLHGPHPWGGGQPFVIDNKAGASGTIAGGMAARAPADGYTLYASGPASTVAELTALVKSKPDALNHGSGGIGSSGHLRTGSYAERAGIKLRPLPYKGDGQVINDLWANQIQVLLTAPDVTMAHAKSGKVRPLAVMTQERVPSIPEVPALHEALPGFEYPGWIILFAPAGTPAAALTALAEVWSQAHLPSPDHSALHAAEDLLALLDPLGWDSTTVSQAAVL